MVITVPVHHLLVVCNNCFIYTVIISWCLYQDMYHIVSKCIIAARATSHHKSLATFFFFGGGGVGEEGRRRVGYG